MASSFLQADDSPPSRIFSKPDLPNSLSREREEEGDDGTDFSKNEPLERKADGNERPSASQASLSSSPPPPPPFKELDVTGAIAAYRRLWYIEPASVEEKMRQTTSDAIEILLTEMSKEEVDEVVKREGVERILFLVALHPVFRGEYAVREERGWSWKRVLCEHQILWSRYSS